MLKKQGFTLAEVMIVLSVIGILTSILLPAAWNNTPDENLIKFKKAHNTFASAIRELIMSDKYYMNGSFCEPTTGEDVNGDGEINLADAKYSSLYFCKTFVELVNVKSAKCGEKTKTSDTDLVINVGNLGVAPTQAEIEAAKQLVDTECKKSDVNLITLENGVQIFKITETGFFGQMLFKYSSRPSTYPSMGEPGFCEYNDYYPAEIRGSDTACDNLGFGTKYKIFCIDVDGIHPDATDDDCVNECPFGYGVRADGKIFTGARADEWLAKSLQGED